MLTDDIYRDAIYLKMIYRQSTYIHYRRMNMSRKNEPLTESYFYILLCLYHTPMHGYGIMQKTAELSQGNVKIGSGTMYGATENMMKKGWIRETFSDNPEDKRKRLYELTDSGRDILEQEIRRLKHLVEISEKVIKEGK